MKTLAFCGSVAAARRAARKAAVVVVWRDEQAETLRAAGITARAVSDHLDAAARDAVDDAALTWTKRWGRRPLVDGKSFRDLHAWKGVSLWWFAELFLHHGTGSPRRVRLIETFDRVLDAERPDEVEANGLSREDALLLGRVCLARGTVFHGRRRGSRMRARAEVARVSLRARWNTAKTLAGALKAELAGAAPLPPHAGGPVLFLSHAAFWRERADGSSGPRRYEHYFDRLIPEVRQAGLQTFVLAVGPEAAFRRRGLRERMAEWLRLPRERADYVPISRYTRVAVARRVLTATRQMRRAWRGLKDSPAVAEAFTHRGVRFFDLAEADLAATLLLQLPWAVRCYEEMAAALAAVRPAVACLYAESSAWGRAALAACRAAGVPTVAVQHGILYPRYYSYVHEPDEADCPRPDRTAVFGQAARRLLIEMGSYRPESLVLTGSPKFDALVDGARERDRRALRARLGVPEGERLVLVASRFRAIRPTHQAIGTAFPSLLRAVESLPGVRAVVKPHPAEPDESYRSQVSETGARRTSVVPPSADLVELLLASDALVTVESLSAVEALVLGRPVLVLNMPTNLRELVDRGVALGVEAGQDPRPALLALLFDEATGERLRAARERYLSEMAMGVDGRATERIVGLIRETAAGGAVVGF